MIDRSHMPTPDTDKLTKVLVQNRGTFPSKFVEVDDAKMLERQRDVARNKLRWLKGEFLRRETLNVRDVIVVIDDALKD